MLYCHDQLYKHICIQNHNDGTIRSATQFFRKIYLSLYLKEIKRVTKGFTVRGSWRPNRTATY